MATREYEFESAPSPTVIRCLYCHKPIPRGAPAVRGMHYNCRVAFERWMNSDAIPWGE